MSQIVRKVCQILRNKRSSLVISSKYFHNEFPSNSPDLKDKKKENITSALNSKYDIFRDDDSQVILDVDEERSKYNREIVKILPVRDVMEGINLKRGVSGVFEINELVDLLKRENASDIVVCRVPKSIKYVDHMCIVTGMSKRHIIAIAQFVRKVFKHKRNSTDILPKIEGESGKDWVALDLGNIALHIFSEGTRKIYDLESLWSIGPQFDIECNKPQDALVELYERHSVYLSDLTPKVQKKDLG